MSAISKPRSFLAAARVANLPGVACHGITGALLAQWLISRQTIEPQAIDWGLVSMVALAGILLCVAGNLLNDWHDRGWDREFRPERALPSGHFRPATFLVLGSLALLLGVAAMFVLDARAGGIALAIAGCVVIYTRCHKTTVWSVVPLALCRGLLPIMGAFAVAGGLPWDTPALLVIPAFGAALFFWVCGLSLDARGESTGASGRSLFPWLLLVAAPCVMVAALAGTLRFPWFALVPVGLWLVLVRGPFRRTAKQRVSALLAGLPLLDFLVLAPVWMLTAGAPHGILWIPMLAFASGRLLQRAASAT